MIYNDYLGHFRGVSPLNFIQSPEGGYLINFFSSITPSWSFIGGLVLRPCLHLTNCGAARRCCLHWCRLFRFVAPDAELLTIELLL